MIFSPHVVLACRGACPPRRALSIEGHNRRGIPTRPDLARTNQSEDIQSAARRDVLPDERQAQARIEFTDATIESLTAAPTTLGSQGGVNVNRAVLPDSAWDTRLEIGGAPSRGGRACSDSARDTAQRFASGGTDP